MNPLPSNVAEAFDRLTEATHEFSRSVEELKRQQIESAVGIKRRQVLTIVLLAVMVLGTVVAGYAAYQIRDCTVTTGKCFQNSQRRTGGAVGFIVNEVAKKNAAANATIDECVVVAKGDLKTYHVCLRGYGLPTPK